MATETQFWGRDAEAFNAHIITTRARIMREALEECAKHDSDTAYQAALMLARNASDETLAKLVRLVK